MNRDQMIWALISSGNGSCRMIATRIYLGESTIEEEMKYAGSFMTAVLEGDFEAAVRSADPDNLIAFAFHLAIEDLPKELHRMVKNRMVRLGMIPEKYWEQN